MQLHNTSIGARSRRCSYNWIIVILLLVVMQLLTAITTGANKCAVGYALALDMSNTYRR
jgi:hypothetical protein